MKKTYHVKNKHKKADMAILISDKMNHKTITRDRVTFCNNGKINSSQRHNNHKYACA